MAAHPPAVEPRPRRESAKPTALPNTAARDWFARAASLGAVERSLSRSTDSHIDSSVDSVAGAPAENVRKFTLASVLYAMLTPPLGVALQDR